MLAAIRVPCNFGGLVRGRNCDWSTLACSRQISSCAQAPEQEKHPAVTVIGGGAAGLTAAYFAALKLNEEGSKMSSGSQSKVLVLERTKEAGKKVLMSGGTRCNVLPSEIDLDKCWSWLSDAQHIGLDLSLEEESNKWFPTSNSSRRLGVEFKYNSRVVELSSEPARKRPKEATTWCIKLADGSDVHSAGVVVATGGLSFPQVGTDGSGHQILEHLGHRMVEPYAALTPLLGEHPRGAEGGRIPGVSLGLSASVVLGKKKIDACRTGFLFTHKGYSGPAVLDLSHHFVRSSNYTLATPVSDAAPSAPKLVVKWSQQTADEWLARFKDPENRETLALSIVKKELPDRLAASLYDSIMKGPRKCRNLTRREAASLAAVLGSYELPVSGHQGYKLAEVTGGGVKLEEIDCKTMESVHWPKLFLCGEVCDVFGRIGGFNFYWAWVSGRAAGLAAAGSDWTKCDV